MDVRLYTSPSCGYCHQAKRYLAQKGIRFTEHDVSRDRAAADEVVRLTGQMGVPVIVADGQVVVGFDRPRLDALFRESGSGRPKLGLKVADASRMAAKVGAVPVFGALVGAVAPSSPGEKAGIKPGDIITELNLRPINKAEDLEKAFAAIEPGGRATLVFLRGQVTMRSEIQLS